MDKAAPELLARFGELVDVIADADRKRDCLGRVAISRSNSEVVRIGLSDAGGA